MVGIKGVKLLKVQKYYEKVKRRRRANMERKKEIINKLKELVDFESVESDRKPS